MQQIFFQKLIRHRAEKQEMRQAGTNSLQNRPELAKVASSILAARRARIRYFGPGLFRDLSWDILLDLRAHHGEHRSVASLFVSDYGPTTTGLRHLRELHEAGLIERWKDPEDARRRLASLSMQGLTLMDQFLTSLLYD